MYGYDTISMTKTVTLFAKGRRYFFRHKNITHQLLADLLAPWHSMVARCSKTPPVPASKMNEEEDLAVLIYKSSKTAKARAAAAAAAKEKGQVDASTAGRRTIVRKRSFTSRDK